jgi:hypothetical protein
MNLSHYKNLSSSLLSLIAFIILVYFIFQYYSLGDRPWVFYTSDSVYIPYLYRDLILRHGSILQWTFSPVPYFFPDTFVYFILAAAVKNLKVAIVLFAFFQYSLYYWLIVTIGKEVFGRSKTTLFRLSTLIALLGVATGHLQQETLNLGLISQTHFSTALMFLFGLVLILKTFYTPNTLNYALLFAVCFLTTFSDILFITQFVVVALVSLCLMLMLSNKDDHEKKRIYTNNIFIITISSIISYLIYRHSFFFLNMSFGGHLIKRYSASDLMAATEKIYKNLMLFSQNNAVVVGLLIMFLVLSAALIGKALYYRVKDQQTCFDCKFLFTMIMLFMTVLIGIGSLLFLDNNLMVPGYNEFRHSLPMIIFPVFLGVPLYVTQYTSVEGNFAKYYGYLVLIILLCAYFFVPKGSLGNIIKFYPASIACLDANAEKYHLKDGVTDFYWASRSYSFLSKRALNIVTVAALSEEGFVPRTWFNTLHDYHEKDFNYFITGFGHLVDTDHYQPMNKQMVEKRLGREKIKFMCPSWETGKMESIYVFNRGVINIDFNFKA